MTKKEYLALPAGTMLHIPGAGRFLIHHVQNDGSVIRMGVYRNNNVYNVQEGERISIETLRSTQDSSTPWQRMRAELPQPIKVGTIGKLCGDYTVCVLSIGSNNRANVLIVEDNIIANVDIFLLTRNTELINRFKNHKFRFKKGVDKNKFTTMLNSPLDDEYWRSFPKTFPISRGGQFSNDGSKNFANLKECYHVRTTLNNSHPSEYVEYYVLNHMGHSFAVSVDDIELVMAKPIEWKLGSKVKYIGKDFTQLKRGDSCIVQNIKLDSASPRHNIITIQNTRNNYKTRVFQSRLKQIK